MAFSGSVNRFIAGSRYFAEGTVNRYAGRQVFKNTPATARTTPYSRVREFLNPTKTSFTGRSVLPTIQGHIQAARYNFGVAISGKETGFTNLRWPQPASVVPYVKTVNANQRITRAAQGLDRSVQAARAMPLKVKIGAVAGGIAFASWMNRKQKSRYYTRYYNF